MIHTIHTYITYELRTTYGARVTIGNIHIDTGTYRRISTLKNVLSFKSLLTLWTKVTWFLNETFESRHDKCDLRICSSAMIFVATVAMTAIV